MLKDVSESSQSLSLPLVSLPGDHPCKDCGHCCTYVAVEIDDPTSFKDYDNIYWYLCHRNISVYIDWEGDWFIEFQTLCEHLTEARTCRAYEERPRVCSDFSWDECEKTTGERAWRYQFHTPEDLLGFLRKRRPRAFERYRSMHEKLVRERLQRSPRSKLRKARAAV